jgi:hypothetical protein
MREGRVRGLRGLEADRGREDGREGGRERGRKGGMRGEMAILRTDETSSLGILSRFYMHDDRRNEEER